MRIYHSIKRLIGTLDPRVVIIDFTLNPAFDACHTLNREYVMSSPMAPLDLARAHQPWLKGFWYYPMFVLSLSDSDGPTNMVLSSPLGRVPGYRFQSRGRISI